MGETSCRKVKHLHKKIKLKNTNCSFNVNNYSSSYPHSTIIVDTGATDHFFTPNTEGLHNIKQHPGISVALPDGTPIQASGTATLPGLNLPKECKEVNILKEFSNSLFSIPKICDHNHVAVFDKNKVCIYKQQELAPQKPPIIAGHRNPSTRLWEMKMPK